MTVMSLDLCWTFLRAKVPRRSSILAKFILYSVVGWGSPAIMTSGLVAIDHVFTSGVGRVYWPRGFNITLPNVGRDKCFLTDASHGVFLHFPIMLLMVINGILFIITSSSIYRSGQPRFNVLPKAKA